MAFSIGWVAFHKYDYADPLFTALLYGVFMTAGLFIYIYKTVTRIRPLAYINGNTLTINKNLIFSETIDLPLVIKISCQYITETNQLMKVYYPGKAAIEFEIKQTNCATEDLGNFINQSHSIDVRYS